jgi:hypothetical protein
MSSKQIKRGRRKWARIIAALCISGMALLLIVRHSFSRENIMSNETPIELRVGEKGESFTRRNPTIGTVDRQPAGVNFYELNWSTQTMGTVIVKQGPLSLNIENVISVTGTEDMDLQDEGILEIKINSAITNSEMISHDEARVKTLAYLQKIYQSGWKILLPRSMARIRGKDMNNYLLETGNHTTLDPLYVPSLAEWMEYDDLTSWEFYADRVFLTVQITREHTLTDPAKPGAYLLSTNLQSESEHFRRYVDGLDRARWKQLLMGEITQLAKKRATMESNFRAKGIAIDEAYVDPPLPDLSTK